MELSSSEYFYLHDLKINLYRDFIFLLQILDRDWRSSLYIMNQILCSIFRI